MSSETLPEQSRKVAAAPAAAGELRTDDSAYPHQGQAQSTAQQRQAVDHAAARTIIVGIILTMFLPALEQTIVAPALPAIGRSLGGLDDLSWVVTIYLLAATATTPLFGKLSDIYGRRAVMLSAIGIFVVGSVACALAPSISVLILSRALQGIGAGGLLPLGQAVIGDLLSPRERPVVQSHIAVMYMVASTLGPVLGGLLTDHLHWSFIFWINLPLGIVAFVMSDRALRRLPRNERPHQLDLIGASLMVAASLSVMVALAWGGTRFPWASWQVLVLLGGSLLLWVLFALRLLSAHEPFIPPVIFGGRVTGTIICAAIFGIGAIFGLTIYTPLYCQAVLGVSASQSGLVLIALMLGTVIGSQITMRFMLRLKHYMRIPMVTLTVAIAVLAVLAANVAGHSVVVFGVLLFVLGLGFAPLYPMTMLIMQNSVEPHQMGTATGTLTFARSLGGALIVAVFGAIVLSGMSDNSGVVTLEKITAQHGDLGPAFQHVFIAAMICTAIALCCFFTMEEKPLQGPTRLRDAGGE